LATCLVGEFADSFVLWLDGAHRSGRQYLVDAPSLWRRKELAGLVKDALRSAYPSLECYSVRRGALQALNDAGEIEATLLLFSRHKSIKTLRKYLGMRSSKTGEARARSAAAALTGGGGPDGGPGFGLRYGRPPRWRELGLTPADWRAWPLRAKASIRLHVDALDILAGAV
jgi:hypothetical protein